MLKICQEYGVKHNLVFSTDPNPAKSKTKCLYFCGRSHNVEYPAPLILDGKPLPWVITATHLGHELSQVCNMDQDIKVKKARFIADSTEIRETFGFAKPEQVLRAVRLYCSHYYGGMLWDLTSELAGQFFRTWNTCVKLSYDIPRSTHTYLVQNSLASDFLPVKTELMARYTKFYKSLQNSSTEISALVNIVSKDARSTTARNLALISEETGSDVKFLTPVQVRQLVKVPPTPVNHLWRAPLLFKLLQERSDLEQSLQDTKVITTVINSLCSS